MAGSSLPVRMRGVVAANLIRARRRLVGTHDGEAVLRSRFEARTGRSLDLSRPATFTEKLYWRMISQHRRPEPMFTELADKFRVRDYVRQRVGDEFLTPLIWHGTAAERIPWSELPMRYVIKANHGCAHVIRVLRMPDSAQLSREIDGWLSTNYYWTAREMQYLRIPPRILVEPYLEDNYVDGPLDYRFFCFDGEVAAIQVDDHSHSLHRFYDHLWRPLPYSYRVPLRDYPVSRPADLPLMLDIASELSRGLDFVRVDLYATTRGVQVGELTLTPTGGYLLPFHQPRVESILGDAWRLPGGLPPASRTARLILLRAERRRRSHTRH